jgi:hypothetical protein
MHDRLNAQLHPRQLQGGLLSLPNELLDSVMSTDGRLDTLLALSLTSRRLHSLAIPRLWEKPMLLSGVGQWVRFLRALRDHEVLSNHIVGLKVNVMRINLGVHDIITDEDQDNVAVEWTSRCTGHCIPQLANCIRLDLNIALPGALCLVDDDNDDNNDNDPSDKQVYVTFANILRWISSCPHLRTLAIAGLSHLVRYSPPNVAQLHFKPPATLQNFVFYDCHASKSVFKYFWRCFPGPKSAEMHRSGLLCYEEDELQPIKSCKGFRDLEILNLSGSTGWSPDWPSIVPGICTQLKCLRFPLEKRLEWTDTWKQLSEIEVDVGPYCSIPHEGELEDFNEALKVRRFPMLWSLCFLLGHSCYVYCHDPEEYSTTPRAFWTDMRPTFLETCFTLGINMQVRDGRRLLVDQIFF